MIKEHNKREQMETINMFLLSFDPDGLNIRITYFRYYVNIGYTKTRPNVKIFIVPEEGWFGQPKYSTPSKNHPTLCRFLHFICKAD